MYKDPPAADRINSFALVCYIPDPLAGFLDRLRQELVPNCFLRAHVTILTPRPISSSPEEAWKVIQALTPGFRPFEIELNNLEVFPVSDVIYIGISAGSKELREMNAAFNIAGLCFREPFPYVPHVTLAQDLQSDEVDELARVARSPLVGVFVAQEVSGEQSDVCAEHPAESMDRPGREQSRRR